MGTKRGHLAQVCLEATGVYSLEIALALHHHPKTKVMVINPKAIHNYAGATMQRAKTDQVDARLDGRINYLILKRVSHTLNGPIIGSRTGLRALER